MLPIRVRSRRLGECDGLIKRELLIATISHASGGQLMRGLGGTPIALHLSGTNSRNSTVFTDVLRENSPVICGKRMSTLGAVRHGYKGIGRLILKIPQVTAPYRIKLRTQAQTVEVDRTGDIRQLRSGPCLVVARSQP